MFGSTGQNKRELAVEFAATIAFSAVASNDQVGLIMFSDRIEKFIPPAKGRTHALRILRDILYFKPQSKGTNFTAALSFFNRIVKHRTIAFIVSDFADFEAKFEKMLAVTSLRHDTIAIVLNDELDVFKEDCGLVELYDLESGEAVLVDTSDKKFREVFKKEEEIRSKKLRDCFRRGNVDSIELSTGISIQKPLLGFFRRRERQAPR